MRSDIAKLTTEQERAGSGYCESKKYGGRVPISPDPDHEYPKEHGGFHSSARRRHRDYKTLTDVLNPLYGQLRKNVGRQWDDVYSEFCQHLDKRSVAGIHIFSHLVGRSGAVAIGGLWVGASGTVYRVDNGKVDGYYVHPMTGILCYAPLWRYQEPKLGHIVLVGIRDGVWYDTRRIYQPKSQFQEYYELVDGLWFARKYQEIQKPEFIPASRYLAGRSASDLALRGYVQHPKTNIWGQWVYRTAWTATFQRSLNRKEIRAIRKWILATEE